MIRNPPAFLAFVMFVAALFLAAFFHDEAQIRQCAFYLGISAFAAGAIWK